ncbi:MAG: hypothetical protein E8D45_02950 [Nitrospira sp.]|nr:MAG: hypothetical protein E8D45_02950 [Nitrospira sp.]
MRLDAPAGDHDEQRRPQHLRDRDRLPRAPPARAEPHEDQGEHVDDPAEDDRGLDVKLPLSTSNTIKAEERVVVTVERDQKIYLDKESVGAAQLEGKLRALKRHNPEVGVYLRADRTVPYGSVVQVMDSVRRAGIEKMGMVTDAPGEERVVEDPIRSKSKGAGR